MYFRMNAIVLGEKRMTLQQKINFFYANPSTEEGLEPNFNPTENDQDIQSPINQGNPSIPFPI